MIISLKMSPLLETQAPRHSSCTTLQAGRLCCCGFKPDLRQYASRMSCPCGLTVVCEMSGIDNKPTNKTIHDL